MVVLRLKRMGRAHSPFYRLNAMDKRSPRDGAVIEQLGWYQPSAPAGKQWELNAERIKHWLSVGAQPSETASDLFKKVGINAVVGKNKKPMSKRTTAKHAV
ncbi:MAG: 30S ribosomal protein S16 [Planctomycetota bacterium]|nr:30S ribosomal protein S16 [Planctomycetota bacterium]